MKSAEENANLKGLLEEKEGLKVVRIGIAGTPNSGKTTLFNLLTGTKQHTGNWPGVTVERKVGKFSINGIEVEAVDLPGTYGLSPHSLDEKIARDYIIDEKPDAIVVVIDATNLERNLFLVSQILSLGVPTVVVFNMMDLVERTGLNIDVKGLSRFFDVPIIPMVALKGIGLSSLKRALKNTVGRKRKPYEIPYLLQIEEELKEIEKSIPDDKTNHLPKRWLATRLLCRDPKFIKWFPEVSPLVEKILNEKLRMDQDHLETAMVSSTFEMIQNILDKVVRKGKPHHDPYVISEKIDRFLIHKYFGILIFLIIMGLTFELTFLFANPFVKIVGIFFDWLTKGTIALGALVNAPHFLVALFAQGLIPGIGAVFTFVPTIFILFGAIAVLEDTGYMARAAFITDRYMTAIGLPGRAFIPMILGFGCNVPAILATRTLENEDDRLLTILVIPFMSCSARLPIYVLFASVFFPHFQGVVVFSLYLLGIGMAIFSVRVMRKAVFKSQPGMFVMELPPYRMPSLRSILLIMWQRGMLFVKKAGSIIALTSLVVWFLGSMPPGVEYASRHSILGLIGSKISPILKPAGFAVPEIAIALLAGFLAKEVVIGTLGTLFGAETLKTALLSHFTPISAYAFLVMSLLYIPCVATMAVIKQETGSYKWVGFAVAYTLLVGYSMAVIVYQLGSLIF